ncbi:hypothetical protein [Kitasatospora cinereorecta]|uniref:Uncharacterized protein n=1 Tax=Kitasatospora cinereorecta TaxID=285560 RepID=A0ABW0VNS9_9ACTN
MSDIGRPDQGAQQSHGPTDPPTPPSGERQQALGPPLPGKRQRSPGPPWWQRKPEAGRWELREALRARITELRALLEVNRLASTQAADRAKVLLDSACAELDKAESVLDHGSCPRLRWPAHLSVARTHVDMAYSLLLRMLPDPDFRAEVPGLAALIGHYLHPDDPQRSDALEIVTAVNALPDGDAVSSRQREALIEAAWAARQVLQNESARAASFVHILYAVTTVLALLAGAVAVLTYFSPTLVPICFSPSSGQVCATGSSPEPWDYLVIEIVGMVAAAVAAAVSLRQVKGTATAYNVPVALAVLKLPSGALTALLGLLLMRGQFVPGLTNLDSSAQIIAYGIVFGYAQQVGTRLIDRQGQAVLKAVGAPASAPSVPGTTASPQPSSGP